MQVTRDPTAMGAVLDRPDFELVEWLELSDADAVERIGEAGFFDVHIFQTSEGFGAMLAHVTDEDEGSDDFRDAEWWTRRYVAMVLFGDLLPPDGEIRETAVRIFAEGVE